MKRILIVGAFPKPGKSIYGGNVTDGKILLESSFSSRFRLELIDSTQISNPPPGFIVRFALAMRRITIYCYLLCTKRPDAVLIFTSSGFSLLEKSMMAAIARYGSPVLIFPGAGEIISRAEISAINRVCVKLLFRNATHFLCQGRSWQRFATGVLGFPLARAPIIPNWTATDRLLSIGERRVTAPSGHIPQLLFLGWLEHYKGIFELLEACKALSLSHSFRLVIAGRGTAESHARAYAESMTPGTVTFAGWVDAEFREQLLEESDIFILPSWAEGLPNAMIEAMAAKLAVVVSAVGIVPDLIADGHEALLVPPKEVGPLKQAIEHLLIDVVFREELAERGHAFARENFAVEPAVAKLTAVIEAAIVEEFQLENG